MKKNTFLTIVPIFAFLAVFPFQCGSVQDAGVFKSQNKGETWERKVNIDNKSSIGAVEILTIALDPQDSKIIYLGTRANGLYKSKDAGDAWAKVEDKNGNIFKAEAVDEDIIMASTKAFIKGINKAMNFKKTKKKEASAI